jgi:hypothetical protein
MRPPRARRESQPVDLYPPLQACPTCHEALTEGYHKQRWMMRLDQEVTVGSHFLECSHPDGARPGAVDRPYQEDTLAVRGDTFGMEVVVRMGERRYDHNFSITRLRSHRPTAAPRSICRKEVALRCEGFLALVTPVARQAQELIAPLSKVGRIVRAIDGVQPAKSHDPR